MAQPTSRQTLVDYCKRQLGYPVLEVNVADEQIDDLVDDAIQYFQERHFDGVFPTLLKYKFSQEDIDRGKGKDGVGITTTSTTETIGDSLVQFDFEENSNYLKVPDDVIGITKVFQFEGSNSISSGMFSVKYQLFLNDIYYWGSTELLTYAMTKTYLEDIDFLLSTQKQIRFNQRMNRLYLDIDWSSASPEKYLIIDCYRGMNPDSHTKVWNDSFLKKYLTSLIKRQWGQNMMKFQGMKLPGGVELNGRQMYDDAEKELEIIREQMLSTYELPPFDMIG